jgi:hypothetical protein
MMNMMSEHCLLSVNVECQAGHRRADATHTWELTMLRAERIDER